jgi:hypothetical protein
MGIIITHCRKGRRFIRVMLRVIVTPLRNDNSGRTAVNGRIWSFKNQMIVEIVLSRHSHFL